MDDEIAKVVLLGRGGVGKTTLRKIFFDRESPLVLIRQTLSPTLGAEVNAYDLGLKIAVHDLAGQELNHWLTDGSSALDLSDAIFLILDCSDDWDDNMKIISQVQQVQLKKVPSAFIIVFFHKIDLLTKLQRANLKKKIPEAENYYGENIRIYLTSIQENYILETFWVFIQAFKKSMCRKHQVDFRDFIVKMELLRYFTQYSDANLDVLEKKLEIKREALQWYLHQLYANGTLHIDPNSEMVFVGEKGVKTLNTLQNALKPITQEIIYSERNYIRGVILSNKAGIPFYTYECEAGFFNHLVTDQRTNTEPGMISMFFAQIAEFGKSMDYNGLTSFQFGGYNLKIASFIKKDVLAIFFIDRIQIDRGIMKILKEFLKTIFASYGDSIYNYFRSNNIADIARLHRNLSSEIGDLDVIIKSVHQNKASISKEKLLEMYLNLSEESKDKISSRDMKAILFQYLIMESPDSLKEL
jgi:GTPase SAR1 family protein